MSFRRWVSSRMPGPIVELIAAVFTYVPFAADGFARRISSTTARWFCRSCSSQNDLGAAPLEGRQAAIGITPSE